MPDEPKYVTIPWDHYAMLLECWRRSTLYAADPRRHVEASEAAAPDPRPRPLSRSVEELVASADDEMPRNYRSLRKVNVGERQS